MGWVITVDNSDQIRERYMYVEVGRDEGTHQRPPSPAVGPQVFWTTQQEPGEYFPSPFSSTCVNKDV